MANGDSRVGDEELDREGGVFVRRGGREVSCDDAECPPDDYIEDEINDDGVPGTVDDLPLDYGIEIPDAADEALDSVQRLTPRNRGASGTT